MNLSDILLQAVRDHYASITTGIQIALALIAGGLLVVIRKDLSS